VRKEEITQATVRAFLDTDEYNGYVDDAE